MRVGSLPAISWELVFVLGWISPVFDNTPLTALAIAMNGFDWRLLAFAVGFAGSMTWFGSTAGVAVSNLYPETRPSVGLVQSSLVRAHRLFGGIFRDVRRVRLDARDAWDRALGPPVWKAAASAMADDFRARR
jgi:hypothetical protein